MVEVSEHVPGDETGILVASKGPFHTVAWAGSRPDALTWAKAHINLQQASYRVIPGVAAPKNFASGEYEVDRYH